MSENKHKQFKITLVGSGNVAWHLAHAFVMKKHKLNTIISRNELAGKELAKHASASYTSNFSLDSNSSDFVILAVNDSFLPELAGRIQNENAIVLHTSGSVGMSVFTNISLNYGVFYPFQTLTKGVETDFSGIPICIEASDENVNAKIQDLASSISKKVYTLDSEKRRILHLSGVISNNFINHFIALAFDYLAKNNMEQDLLFPLLNETLSKLKKVSPREAQTGPARRKNTEIIEAHKKMLENEPTLKNLYSLISDSIIAYYS